MRKQFLPLLIAISAFQFAFINPAFSQTYSFQSYTVADGLPQSTVSAILQDSKGYMWFGTTAGVSKYNQQLRKRDLIPPPVYITRVSLLENDSAIRYVSELKHSENYLRFDYAGICFTAPKLEGFDTDWQEPALRTVEYTHLPGGHYTFKAKARNKDVIWSEEPAEFSSVITPAFWNTWWFTILAVVLLVSIILGVFKEWSDSDLAIQLKDKNLKLKNTLEQLNQEIDERKRTEEALRKERDKAQKYLDIAGVMFVALDTDGKVIMVNKKGCEILGYKFEEIIGKVWFDNFLPQSHTKEVKKIFKQLMAGEIEPVEYYENPVLTKSGKERIAAWHNTLLKDEAGKIIGTLSSGEDITERKQAQEALKMIEYEKGLILDSMSEIVIYYSCTNLKIEWTNRAAGESVGLSPNKLVGKHCYEIWHNRNEPCDDCPVVKSFETGKPEEDERNTPDGRKWYVRSYPVISAKGAIEGVVEVVQNITERKRAEKVLRESKEFSSSLLNNAPNPILVINQDTSLRYVNTTLEKLTGFSSAELIGRKAPYPWWTEETLQKTSKDLEKAMREGAKRLEELF